MINSDPTRIAALLPHAIVRPIALLTALILVVVVGLLMVQGLPVPDGPRELPAPPPAQAAAGVTLKEVFDYQLRDYKAQLDGLDANVKLQALFIVFTVLLILRRSDSLNLFGNQLPLQWLHLFAPIVLLYLWLNFGFLLHDLILGRREGVDLLTQFSPSTADHVKQAFRDGGFIDGWFLSFIDTNRSGVGSYSGIELNSGTSTALFLVVVLGTLISAAHACLIAITFIGCRRYLRQTSERFLRLYYGLPLLPLLLLITSHYRFAYGGGNRNWIQLYIAFTTVPLVGILLWLALSIDRGIDPASVQCLRRQRRLACPGPPVRTTMYASCAGAPRTVALVGDSLSTGFYVGAIPGMVSRMWRAWKGTWFAGAPGGGGPETRSVFERLCEITPLSAVLHATVSAQVDAGGRHSIIDQATNVWHLSHQVDEVLIGEFPDLLLLWIGHNNIDWRFRVEDLTDESCNSLSAEFVEDYARQMRRLLKGAVSSRKPVVIIVYGLINFKSFFDARREAEKRRKANPAVYPYLEKDYDYFISMRPEHRDGMIRLAECYNKSLKKMCKELRKEIQKSDVRLVYSGALSRAEIRRADMLSDSDAWHPSPAGHSLLAEAAYRPIKKQLKYLGWEPESLPGRAVTSCKDEVPGVQS